MSGLVIMPGAILNGIMSVYTGKYMISMGLDFNFNWFHYSYRNNGIFKFLEI